MRRGVTLIEMLVVVTLISLIVAVSFPAVTSGLDSMHLRQAVRDTVSLFDAGLSRAQRSQQVVEISVSPKENAMWVRAPEAHYERKIEMPDGVTITRVLPENVTDEEQGVRSFYLYPGDHGDEPDVISYGLDGKPGGDVNDADIVSSSIE